MESVPATAPVRWDAGCDVAAADGFLAGDSALAGLLVGVVTSGGAAWAGAGTCETGAVCRSVAIAARSRVMSCMNCSATSSSAKKRQARNPTAAQVASMRIEGQEPVDFGLAFVDAADSTEASDDT